MNILIILAVSCFGDGFGSWANFEVLKSVIEKTEGETTSEFENTSDSTAEVIIIEIEEIDDGFTILPPAEQFDTQADAREVLLESVTGDYES